MQVEEFNERAIEIKQRIKQLVIEYGTAEQFANDLALHLVNALSASIKVYKVIEEEHGDVNAIAAFIAAACKVFSGDFNQATIGPALSVLLKARHSDRPAMYA